MTLQYLFIILGLFLFFWYASLLISAFSGAPTVYQKESTIIKAFEVVELKKNQVVLDLGCGNARSLIIASKQFGAKGIGVEVSPFYFIMACLNVLMSGQSKNTKIYWGNLFKYKKLIKKADVIYLFLHEKIMLKIEPLIFENLNSKAKIVSVTFEFEKNKAIKKLKNPNIFIYKKN